MTVPRDPASDSHQSDPDEAPTGVKRPGKGNGPYRDERRDWPPARNRGAENSRVEGDIPGSSVPRSSGRRERDSDLRDLIEDRWIQPLAEKLFENNVREGTRGSAKNSGTR
jgi:hypothetical protein